MFVAQPALLQSDPPLSDEVERMRERFGITTTLALYLEQRGFRANDDLERFLHPKLQHLTLPSAMADRAAATDRLARAIRTREPVYVFGDYDCDGITSAAILSEVIQALGGSVTTGLASRFAGGYGFSSGAVERVLDSGARLLVTCDCGSSDHESLQRVRDAGVDAIVIDHHLVPAEPLPVLAFLNPHRPDCGFPYKGLASCGLALSMAAALRRELERPLDVRRWLDLVAIGTIADVAPLDGDNRALVRAGLGSLQQARRPGIRALKELAELDAATPLSARDVAFKLAPRINAPGRLRSPELALELLLAKDTESATALAAEIEQLSSERKAQQSRIIDAAVRQVEERGWMNSPALVLGERGWNHGIVGIVAGRLATRYQRPVIVVGFEQDHGRGSVRGPRGARLHDLLSQVGDVVLRFGGHQSAAGVEVRYDRLEELRARFVEACSRAPKATEAATLPGEAPLYLLGEDDPARLLQDLRLLEPCGEGNPSPKVGLRARVVAAREVRGGHLKLELQTASGRRLGGFGIDLGARADALEGTLSLVGELRPDRWRGGDAVELRVEQIESD